MPHEGSTISLAPSPGTLVRLAFRVEIVPMTERHARERTIQCEAFWRRLRSNQLAPALRRF